MPDSIPTLSVAPTVGNSQQSYDDVPYESHPFSQTHPSRLYTIATLFGMRPAPVQRCRVLELGCSTGGNLLPMADYLPDSEFVGVDYSGKQIGIAQEMMEKLGLKNVIFKHASILDVDAAYGTFDYIIAHGVYSWVPGDVQAKIMDICSELLNPNGVAYISYNTFPGWHMRGMIRDMMRYHSSRFNTPQLRTQQARALLDFLAQSVKQEGPYSQLLKAELETLRHQADHYLYHEHLEENNEPLYFHQFMARAQAHNLRYLGESRVGTMVTGNFGPDIEKTLKILATDQIQAEQYMDFLRNRMFRETLLVHNKVNPNWSVQPDVLRAMHVATGARPVNPVTNLNTDENVQYKSASGMQMATNRPLLKAVMQVLGEAFPGSVPFDILRKTARERIGGDPNDPKTVAEDTNVVAIGLLNCYMSSDLIELHGMPIVIQKKPSEKPNALKWARLQAARGASVTNRRHEVLRLNDLDRHLIPLLDGEHTKEQIVDGLATVALSGQLNVQKDNITLSDQTEIRAALNSVIDQALQKVADQALLTA